MHLGREVLVPHGEEVKAQLEAQQSRGVEVLRQPLVLHVGPVKRPQPLCDSLPVRCHNQLLYVPLVALFPPRLSPSALSACQRRTLPVPDSPLMNTTTVAVLAPRPQAA
jgi:hypothetical protein